MLSLFIDETTKLKLYRFTDGKKEYWETWENGDSSHTIHWGILGTRGESHTLSSQEPGKVEIVIQREIDARIAEGFRPIEPDAHFPIIIEYAVEGMGSIDDIDKRQRLDERMNETLGWTGLGACDGSSMGSGTMEVFNFGVDFALAKEVIEHDLAGTEFANYTLIYGEETSLDL